MVIKHHDTNEQGRILTHSFSKGAMVALVCGRQETRLSPTCRWPRISEGWSLVGPCVYGTEGLEGELGSWDPRNLKKLERIQDGLWIWVWGRCVGLRTGNSATWKTFPPHCSRPVPRACQQYASVHWAWGRLRCIGQCCL